MRPSECHSLPGDRTGREKSGHGNKDTEQVPLTSWGDRIVWDKSEHGKSATEGVALTGCRPHQAEQVKSGHGNNATE